MNPEHSRFTIQNENHGPNSEEAAIGSKCQMKHSLIGLNDNCLFNIFNLLTHDELFSVGDVCKILLRAVERYVKREYRRQEYT